MTKLVQPKTFLVGYTNIDLEGINSYLVATGNEDFAVEMAEARKEGISAGEALCSFYAKLCYASLTFGKNKNISKTRAIKDNIVATVEAGHGSVFEHCSLNFVVTNCSRVFTHELVRHRVGTAFSQTSGRYVRTDDLSFVWDDILFKSKKRILELLAHVEAEYKEIEREVGIADMKDFGEKKRLTSAMRRILPNGQANEIGFSINLRTLRHVIEMRTSEHAEWEIRLVFNQVVDLVASKFPAIFADAGYQMVGGQRKVMFANKKI